MGWRAALVEWQSRNDRSFSDGHHCEPGGDYGPEAGAAATLALLISTLVIWKSGWFRPTAEMLAAIKHGKPERPISIIADDETLRA